MSDQHPVMGELLLREGLLTEKQLTRALEEQRHRGGRLGYHLIRLGYVDVQRLSQFLKDSMGLIPYDLVQWVRDPSITDLIPSNLAQFYQVVPVERKGNVLTVAIADLDNPSIIPALEEYTGLRVDPVVCPRETVIRALEHFYGLAKDPGVVRNLSGDHLFVLASASKHIRPIHWSVLKPDSAAAEWLRTLLAEAIRTGSRTIYIKPDERALRVAFRGPGGSEDRFALDGRKREELDALLFELARLRDQRRGPRQEGRVRVQVESRFLTLHVKALSTLQGNRYTLTLYDERFHRKEWEKIEAELEAGERESLRDGLAAGKGMVILAGAPGPALWQVYYGLLGHLRRSLQPAVSLEEHALLSLESVAQTEVSQQEEVSWPELITLALRQEPALFGIFPVKERHSMELALLAASHRRVVAVLHQPDAAATLRWLLRNQFRSALKAGILRGILTVASLARLCPHCKLPLEVTAPDGASLQYFTRQGCEQCLAWEHLPTEPVLEWLPMTQAVAAQLIDEPSPADLRKCILDAGGIPLSQRVRAKAQEGLVDGQDARDYLAD
jgi:type IV pilus assembly protein PilB